MGARKTFSILVSLAALLVGGCLTYPARVEVPGELSPAAGRLEKIRVETFNGSVTLRCVEGAPRVKVRYVRFSSGKTEGDALEFAEAVAVTAERSAGNPGLLAIVARPPAGLFGRSCGARFEIELPPGSAVDVETSNGGVEIADAVGPVVVRTSNGQVKAARVQGDLDLETHNGKIEVLESRGGSVRATTSNGAIVAEETTGSVSLETRNGPITIRAAALPEDCRIEASTSNGRISMEVPSTARARVALRTSNGRVSADLPGASFTRLESDRERLEGILNGGGGSIEAETSNGGVVLRTRT